MSFNVDSFSDAKLDELLTRVTKIPEWELKNTQSERENKRIRQIQIHLKMIRQVEKKRQIQGSTEIPEMHSSSFSLPHARTQASILPWADCKRKASVPLHTPDMHIHKNRFLRPQVCWPEALGRRPRSLWSSRPLQPGLRPAQDNRLFSFFCLYVIPAFHSSSVSSGTASDVI